MMHVVVPAVYGTLVGSVIAISNWFGCGPKCWSECKTRDEEHGPATGAVIVRCDADNGHSRLRELTVRVLMTVSAAGEEMGDGELVRDMSIRAVCCAASLHRSS